MTRRTALLALASAAPALLVPLAGCDGSAGAPTSGGAPPAPSEGRWYLAEEDARRIFPVDLPGYEYDPSTYFRLRPHADYEVYFPEYPGGRYRVRTNASSMREDGEILETQPDLRVLVTGDSHTDGVCLNAESYPNMLEALLSAARPGSSVEVLNCGTGSYTFFNYLGVLAKYLHLEPDAFVVGVFGGNDFGEVLEPWHHFQRSARPTGDKEYERKLGEAVKFAKGFGQAAVSQGFNQYIYFHTFPEQIPVALEAALTVTDEILRICRERGIALVVLYIPPPTEVEFERFRPELEELSTLLGLDSAVFVRVKQLANRYLAALRERGIAVIDARELFAAGSGPWYWRGDLHIDLAANRVIAGALQKQLAGLGG